MNIFLYCIIFLMGIVFGSFYTLGVYRIPKGQDITHTHSYCPKCNHKLGFLDLIPVLSYIFLGGKCRYCKEKIRPRYLILELLSGLTFVAIAYLTGVSIENLGLIVVLESAFLALYLTFVFLMAGIDKEERRIHKSVVLYGIIISILYIIYLCIIEKISIYRYVIYLIFYVLFLMLDTITLRKFAKSSYINGLALALIIMAIFTGEYCAIFSVILASLIIAIYILIYKLKNRKDVEEEKQVWKKLRIGYILAISNILNLICILSYYKFLL